MFKFIGKFCSFNSRIVLSTVVYNSSSSTFLNLRYWLNIGINLSQPYFEQYYFALSISGPGANDEPLFDLFSTTYLFFIAIVSNPPYLALLSYGPAA